MDSPRTRLLILCLVAASAGAQPRLPSRRLPAVTIGGPGWSVSKEMPEQIAARVDKRMNTLRNGVMAAVATMNLSTGSGHAEFRSVIQSPAEFRIEVLRVSSRRYQELRKTIFRAEKGKFEALLDDGWTPRSRANYVVLPKPLLGEFLTRFDDILLRGAVGARPITALVEAGRAAKWRVSAAHNSRFVPPTSQIALVAPDGRQKYVIEVDDRRGLVTQIATEDTRGKKPVRVLWSAAWGIKPTRLTPAEIKDFNPGRAGG